MNDVTGKSPHTSPQPAASHAKRAWQSDVIVDLIKHYGFRYIALNPGASYRGLHDSLVNYGGNDPPLLLCQHEKIAVQIAHGYAKATGKPMVAIVHDVVGMLHATMGIYYAYLDRCPVFVIGATGPMDESRRRPFIDWIHTANVNGEQLRHYVKWDYQPASIEGVPDSFARAYAAMMTEPQGPIYMCYDAWLQEQPLERDVALPKPSHSKVPAPMAADPAALDAVAERLLAADYPVLMAEYVARSPDGFGNLVALAETAGAAVFDVNARLNFPNRHPLNLSCHKEMFRDADLILSLDTRDWEKSTHYIERTERRVVPYYPPYCEMIEIGFGEINLSKWSMDYTRMPACSLRVLGDTRTAIPMLTQLCRERIAKAPRLAARVAERAKAVAAKHDALFAAWCEQAKHDWDGLPITLPRLASEIWNAIKDEDWVLTANTLQDWAYKLWDFDQPHRHPGQALGTGTQIGVSLGVALAHRHAGRLVIDIQPDGDLLFDAGALWSAAKNNIPLLVVMYNNRAYYNDWEHQIHVAQHRGTPVERAYIAQDIAGPNPDFAGLAKSMGWYAEGPIEQPGDIAPALRRAIAQVKAGTPALLDTIVRPR
ncbi:MAG TPA: thiamine pyrophosphate-binding protein [Xanthobacteraceae bacterium]|nr:thiamine pyrophosphate-binding protein [Xanthobacteraceae bacterium]